MENNQVIIFDTTLRDGEQSPGASMNINEKLEVARQLARLKVDVIEAGFPVSSGGDFEAVKLIAQEIEGPVIAGLCRASEKDIVRCWEAVKYSKKPRIHTFIATSDLHITRKLQKTHKEVLETAVAAVRTAKGFCHDVEFSAEDASRSNIEYLCEVIGAVISAGATTINIPDTVGYSLPMEFGEIIKTLRLKVRNMDQAVISVHCHNDLGLAVANTLTALQNGARQIECTINGIGERAGNAALEEIVMAIRTRKDFFGISCGVETGEIYKTSRLVSSLTGLAVQHNKAVVGNNAFAHEAGIHQDGMLKDRQTYEIMSPQDIGVPSNKLVLGKHSGQHALAKRLEELGYRVEPESLAQIFSRFKDLTDKKKYVFDDDLMVLMDESASKLSEAFSLEYLYASSGTNIIPSATLRLTAGQSLSASDATGKPVSKQEAACGDGPVDAAYHAIDKIIGLDVQLVDYALRAISGGKDAQGEVFVKVKRNDVIFTGRGVATDIIEASVKAYLQAINKTIAWENKQQEREQEQTHGGASN